MEETELSRIRGALDAGDFTRARELITSLPFERSAELLELRAKAAYGSGDLEETLTAYGELYRFHLDAGDTHEAAFAAVMVGMYLMMDTGLMATVRAWLSRAERRQSLRAGTGRRRQRMARSMGVGVDRTERAATYRRRPHRARLPGAGRAGPPRRRMGHRDGFSHLCARHRPVRAFRAPGLRLPR